MSGTGKGFVMRLPGLPDRVSFHMTDSPLDRLMYFDGVLEIVTKDGRVYNFDPERWAWTHTETMEVTAPDLYAENERLRRAQERNYQTVKNRVEESIRLRAERDAAVEALEKIADDEKNWHTCIHFEIAREALDRIKGET